MMRGDPQAVPLHGQAITLQFKKYSPSGRFQAYSWVLCKLERFTHSLLSNVGKSIV
jgi:hypothetical protein